MKIKFYFCLLLATSILFALPIKSEFKSKLSLGNGIYIRVSTTDGPQHVIIANGDDEIVADFMTNNPEYVFIPIEDIRQDQLYLINIVDPLKDDEVIAEVGALEDRANSQHQANISTEAENGYAYASKYIYPAAIFYDFSEKHPPAYLGYKN